jgi:hypothetical protein
MVILSALERPVLAMSLPLSYRENSYHCYRFHIPGVTFVATVGGREEDRISVLPAPHPVLIGTMGDERAQDEMMLYLERPRRVDSKLHSLTALRKSEVSRRDRATRFRQLAAARVLLGFSCRPPAGGSRHDPLGDRDGGLKGRKGASVPIRQPACSQNRGGIRITRLRPSSSNYL